jgi:hypothetical protein
MLHGLAFELLLVNLASMSSVLLVSSFIVHRWLQLAPLVFSITRKLGATNRGAFLAGILVIFDMLNTTESRLVLMDAQVLVQSRRRRRRSRPCDSACASSLRSSCSTPRCHCGSASSSLRGTTPRTAARR